MANKRKKPKSPGFGPEMMDTGGGHKGVRGGTSHIGRNRHPSAKSNMTTGLPHHSPGSDGGHDRMRSRAQAPKRKKKAAKK